MPNIKEMDRELIEKLLDLMVIKAALVKANPEIEIKELDRAIIRAKAPMSEEQIAWVEKLVSQW